MGAYLYIHIGYPKTGTSYLQQDVFPNVRGLNYISGNVVYDNLTKISNYAEFSFNYKSVEAEFTSLLTSGINLISHEGLVGPMFFKFVNDKLIADRLSKLFPHARIIITIRNQYDLVRSLYKQYIQQGGTKKFNQFFRYGKKVCSSFYQLYDHTINPEMFDYLNLVNYYVKEFGKENIVILPYEKLRNEHNSFLKELFAFIGCDTTLKFNNTVYNKGYGERQIRLARILNRFFKSDFSENGVFSIFRIPFYGRIDAHCIRRILQSRLSFKLLGSKMTDDENLRKAVKRYFYNSNMELSKRFRLNLDSTYKEYYF